LVFTRHVFHSRIATVARIALVDAFIGLASVSLVSACSSSHPASAPSPSPVTTSRALGDSSSTPSPTATPGVYGNPTAAAKYWIQQSLEDNCGLVSVADVVGEITGQEPTERQMIALGENTPSGTNPGPIYAARNDPSHSGSDGGIEMGDEVVLLQHYGIKSVMTDKTNPDQTGMPALQRYLTDDRKIIAWVNSAIVWNTNDQRTKADHFLVVTGIDTNNQIVHLNDPGADHADEQVPVTTFIDAWQTGGDSIVYTAPPG
jgi:predicted double-glycine peptidase